MSQIQAVTVVIKDKNNRFLLGKRSLWKTAAPGYWCPISGKLEAEESEEDAVGRECWEEIGVEVKALFKIMEMDTRDSTCRLHWWMAEIVSGEAFLKNDEHTELGWFTIEEIQSLTPTFHEDLAILRTLT